MTDDNQLPTRQAKAIEGRSAKLTVTGKLKVAIDLMLEGSRRADAATAAGLKDHSVREALKKPHVRAYWNRGLEVLRESERARNVFAMADVRDNSTNDMARVSAAKALEYIAEPTLPGGSGGGRSRSGYIIDLSEPAGLTIVISNRPPVQPDAPGLTIDVTPNENDNDR